MPRRERAAGYYATYPFALGQALIAGSALFLASPFSIKSGEAAYALPTHVCVCVCCLLTVTTITKSCIAGMGTSLALDFHPALYLTVRPQNAYSMQPGPLV